MSCSFSYKSTTGIKIKWLVFNAVLSFCCCSSPGSYQSSLNGPSRLSQGLATRDALRPGYAAVLSSSQQHLASMYLFATVLINCSFSQVLHEVLTGLRLCLVSLALSYYSVRKKVKSLSHVWLFATPWTVALQAPLSLGFSRREYWSVLPFPSPEHLPDPGIEPGSPTL